MKFYVLGRYGPYPAANGACSGYFIQQGKTKLMLDAGTGTMSRLLKRTTLDDLDAIMLSHLHADHMADLLVMHVAIRDSQKRKMPLYCPRTPENIFALLSAQDCYDIHVIDDDMEIEIGDISVRLCQMTHPVEAYASRISYKGGGLAYSGDSTLNDRIVPFVSGASMFLCDAGLLERDLTPNSPHMSAKQAGEVGRDAKVDWLALTHIRPTYSVEEVGEEARQAHKNAVVVEEDSLYSF